MKFVNHVHKFHLLSKHGTLYEHPVKNVSGQLFNDSDPDQM